MESVHARSSAATTTQAHDAAEHHDHELRQWLKWGVGGSVGAAVGGILGFGTIALIIGGAAGRLVARWYARRRHHSQGLIGFVAWANTVTWLLPVVGMVTAAAILAFPGQTHAKRNVMLGWVGVALSIASAIYGVVQNHMI